MRMMSPGCRWIVVLNPLAVDERAVAAIEVAERPLPLRLKHLGVVAAAPLVLHDDRVGRRTADRDRFAVDQTKHVGPFRAFANNQVCRHRIHEQNADCEQRPDQVALHRRTPHRGHAFWTRPPDRLAVANRPP